MTKKYNFPQRNICMEWTEKIGDNGKEYTIEGITGQI